MSYGVKITPLFERELKKIAKKHKAIKSDIARLIEELEAHPTKGKTLVKTSTKSGYQFLEQIGENPVRQGLLPML